jgi:hypothetical protein
MGTRSTILPRGSLRQMLSLPFVITGDPDDMTDRHDASGPSQEMSGSKPFWDRNADPFLATKNISPGPMLISEKMSNVPSLL